MSAKTLMLPGKFYFLLAERCCCYLGPTTAELLVARLRSTMQDLTPSSAGHFFSELLSLSFSILPPLKTPSFIDYGILKKKNKQDKCDVASETP